MVEKRSEESMRKKKTYVQEYAKQKYKRVPLDLTHEQYDLLKSHADACGEPVNTFIKNAIHMRISQEE